jgi:hypothetical protein
VESEPAMRQTEETIMNHKVITKMLLTALSLLGSVASASTWYVDGVIFFFSPDAAALVKTLIERFGGMECSPPVLSERLVLLSVIRA